MERTSIKLTHAALDEEGAEIILRGVIDPSSLVHLKVAEYQREILPERRIGSLMAALQKGGVPDIQLGCRGGNFIQRENGQFYIQDDVYIVDGLQRTTAAIKLYQQKGITPRLGATVSFNTTEALERDRFKALNVTRVRLSPNVLLRNMRHESESIAALYTLCMSSQFALYKRVCWQQRMKREELVTAIMLLHTTSNLHARFGIGLTERSMARVGVAIEKAYNYIGRATLLGNIREYWSVLDKCFTLHDVVYRESSIVLRGGFLFALAQVFAKHKDFWRDTEFKVPPELQQKLAKFPVQDPHVQALATSTGLGIRSLSALIVDHLNSGKRTKRLTPFADAPREPRGGRPDDLDDNGHENGHEEAA